MQSTDNLKNVVSSIETKDLNQTHQDLVKYFKSFCHDKNNTKSYKKNTCKITVLSQKDFDHGTYRITTPGYYILSEDIVFHPNPQHNFRPTPEQIRSKTFPVPGPYNLNFFAALTVETTGVVVDLNNFTIKQSKEHFLVQRFYSTIELASAPFIAPQGPSPGISGDHQSGKKVAIINGTLGLSSHHGLHGNSSSEILLANLVIEDFQVGGISLNGLKNSLFCNLTIRNTTVDVPVISSFSQAIFTLQFLENMMRMQPDETSQHIVVNHKKKSREEIYNELNDSINKAKKEILKNNSTTVSLFKNHSGLSDANVYGIALNVNGVLIGDFIKKRPDKETTGNENICLKDITISNIVSETKEIIGLSDSTLLVRNNKPSYGKGSPAITGPVGGLFDYERYTSKTGSYISNVLGNAQAFIGLYSNKGTIFFTKPIIDWISGEITIKTVLEDRNINKIFGADSMNHVMKGNIGLFISGGKNMKCTNIIVNHVENKGVFKRENKNKTFDKTKKTRKKEKGEKAFEYAMVACENVSINEKTYHGDEFIA